MHTDPSWFTLNLALNKKTSYSGGGVHIPESKNHTIVVDEGHAIIHPGFVVHQSASMDYGLRYGFQVWVNMTSFNESHAAAYIAGQEVSYRRSIARVQAAIEVKHVTQRCTAHTCPPQPGQKVNKHFHGTRHQRCT